MRKIEMRKIVASEFVSLDGVMESPETWQFLAPCSSNAPPRAPEGPDRDQVKALRPVRAWPRTRVWTSLVPS